MDPQTNNNEGNQTPPAGNMPNPGGGSGDNSQYRTFAILGYILPFLFFLPLLDEKTKNVPYVRFHANQQLVLLITIVVVMILQNMLFGMFMMGALMMLGYYIGQLLNLAILVLVILGAINAYKGEAKELPIIGKFKVLK